MKEYSSLSLSLSDCPCLCTPWSLPAILATPTALHCRVVDIFKQQRQVPCSERAQQLLTGNWQLAAQRCGEAHAAYTLCAVPLTLPFSCLCVCECKLPACRYLTQDSPNGCLLPSATATATARRSGTNKVRIV